MLMMHWRIIVGRCCCRHRWNKKKMSYHHHPPAASVGSKSFGDSGIILKRTLATDVSSSFSMKQQQQKQKQKQQAWRPLSTTTTTTSSTTSSTTQPQRRVVCVALSGGVDSSVAAALLKESLTRNNESSNQHHHQLQAIHMSNWNARDDDDDDDDDDNNNDDDDTTGGSDGQRRPAVCTSEGDWNDASRVARYLNIPITRRCYESDYWLSVFEPYLNEIQNQSLMGNPDVNCNLYIKFGILRDDCLQRFGSDSLLATGHYARLWRRQQRQHRNGQGNGDNNKQHNYYDSDSWLRTTSGLIVEDDEFAILQQEVEESLQDDIEHYEWLWTWGSSSSSSSKSNSNSFDNSPLLLAAVDRSKDQSYFLSACFTHQFRNVIFPLGSYHKKNHHINNKNDKNDNNNNEITTVRQVAREMGLPTAEKKESMGICFVGKPRSHGGFNSFVQGFLPESSSSLRVVNFVDIDSGEIISSSSSSSSSTTTTNNDGNNKRQQQQQAVAAVHYSPGQGAKISGSATRYFVVRQEKESSKYNNNNARIAGSSHNNNNNNTVVVWVCAGTHHPALYADSLTINKMHWMTGEIPSPLLLQNNTNNNSSCCMMRVQCRIRHLQPLVDCTIVSMKKKNNNDYSDSSSSSIEVLFDKPLRGITPGQRAVFYAGRNGLICLGGGVIASSGPSYFEMGKSLPPVNELHPSGANDLSVGGPTAQLRPAGS